VSVYVQQHDVQLLIVARDAGSPALSANVTMHIEITQTINEYPHWVRDYSSAPPIRIPESVPVNHEVGRFRATSTVPDASLNYFIARGETPQQNGEPISFYERLDERTNEMVLLTYRPLDYETLSHYTLTVKAAVSFSVVCSQPNRTPLAAICCGRRRRFRIDSYRSVAWELIPFSAR